MAFRLRTGRTGIRVRLHDLEADVMDVVWSRDLVHFCVQDVLNVLEKRREIAYTTVMTTLGRLHRKGLLEREREGKRYLYSPKLTREQFIHATAREVLDGLAGPAREPLALLAETVSTANRGELDALERLIRRRRKELGQ